MSITVKSNRRTITVTSNQRPAMSHASSAAQSLPTGGTDGQVLRKRTSQPFDAAWEDEKAHYEQPFTNSASVTVTHNLNRKPAVSVVDSAGDQVVGEVHYTDANSLVISFSASFSGMVLCN